MKKFCVLAMAAAAMTACTNEETVNMVSSAAIGFQGSGVTNSTRASDVTTDNFSKFVVYGGYNATGNVFDGVEVSRQERSNWTYTPPQYWVENQTYKFAAYSPKAAGVSGASWGYDAGLTFNLNSDNDNQNDVVYAVNNNVATGADVSQQQNVSLTFNHILSKVNFKFTKGTSVQGQKVELSKFTLSGVTTDATFNAGVLTPGSTATTPYVAFAEAAEIDGTKGVETGAYYVVPQNVGTFTMSMTATVTDAGGTVLREGTVTATLPKEVVTQWVASNSYRYSAKIEMSNIINPDKPDPKPIIFTVDHVNDWTDAEMGGDGNVSPNEPE